MAEPFDPNTAMTATTADEALELARAWADGRRSWLSVVLGQGYDSLGGRDQTIAVMDAQEVVKWSALSAAFHSQEGRNS
jgi:kynureninase